MFQDELRRRASRSVVEQLYFCDDEDEAEGQRRQGQAIHTSRMIINSARHLNARFAETPTFPASARTLVQSLLQPKPMQRLGIVSGRGWRRDAFEAVKAHTWFSANGVDF